MMNKNAQSSLAINELTKTTDDAIEQFLAGIQSDPMFADMSEAEKINLAQQFAEQAETHADAAQAGAEMAKDTVNNFDQMSEFTSNKYFELKMAQAPMDPGISDGGLTDPNAGPMLPEQGLKFTDASEIRDYLEAQRDIDTVLADFMSLASDEKIVNDEGIAINPRQVINDSLKEYMEGKTILPSQEKLRIAMNIFDVLPQAAKNEEREQPGMNTQIPAIEKAVAESNMAVRKAAEALAIHRSARIKSADSSSGFNMKKFAQHKAMENNIMFGPDQTRVDPFTGQLISNWHIYERNKGFGFKLDDALDVDYETLWRTNIMDKYYRDYKGKDGKWTGGYIRGRFEVDRYVPAGNEYQLKPGQKRRPHLPEYGVLEGRLQNMRSSGKDKRGREWTNTEKPYNWNPGKDGDDYKVFNWKLSGTKKKRG